MDDALRAIAEPRRREILWLVRSGELPVGEIAAHFSVTRPAISQHLRVLRDAGLVVERREGTHRYYRANPDRLAALRAELEWLWDDRLARLKALAEADEKLTREDASAMAAGKAKVEMPGYRDDVLEVLDAMLADRPDVRRGTMFGMPGYFTGRKMFVCCWDQGISLKLPVERVAELQRLDDEIHPHAPGGRLMKEWVYIARSDAAELHGDAELLDESIAFVAASA